MARHDYLLKRRWLINWPRLPLRNSKSLRKYFYIKHHNDWFFCFACSRHMNLFIEIPKYLISIYIYIKSWLEILHYNEYEIKVKSNNILITILSPSLSFFTKMQKIRSYKYFNHIMQCFFICKCPPKITNALSVCTFCTFNLA